MKYWSSFTTNQLHEGRIGYEAYGAYTNMKTFDGRDMPPWDKLPDRTQNAWTTAAQALKEQFAPDPVDE